MTTNAPKPVAMPVVERFACLADACPDTCCKGWGMQVDDATLDRWRREHPSLLDAVGRDADGNAVMARKGPDDQCLKLTGNLCRIHQRHGDGLLSDTCYFYPRVLRRMGGGPYVTATLSCPEIARLALIEGVSPRPRPSPFGGRAPSAAKTVEIGDLDGEAARAVTAGFLGLVDDAATPERAMARVVSLARSLTASLEKRSPAEWPRAIAVLSNAVDGRLPTPIRPDPLDPFRLAQALAALVYASHKPRTPAFLSLFNAIEDSLAITVDWSSLNAEIDDDRFDGGAAVEERWRRYGQPLRSILRRWLRHQLAAMAFPFGGLGDGPLQRAMLLAIRFATFRLSLQALIGEDGERPADGDIVAAAYTLARFLDHLADPALSLKLYGDLGWLDEARLRAVVGDAPAA